MVKLFLNLLFCPLPGTRLSPKSAPAARPVRFIIVPLCLRPPKVLDAMADSCPSCNQRGGIALAIVPAGDASSAMSRNCSVSSWFSYAVSSFCGQRKASPVISMRCMITASLRARATQAFLWLLRRLMRRAQSFKG